MITKEVLDEIVALTNIVPEEYRQKCFEILLESTLRENQPFRQDRMKDEDTGKVAIDDAKITKISLSLDVRAFFSTYGLDEKIIEKFFLVEASEIRPIYKLRGGAAANQKKQHALLLCLGNAIINDTFECEVDVLKQRCIETGCYETSNFTKVFSRNPKLLKLDDEEKIYALTPDGKSELADLLESLLE